MLPAFGEEFGLPVAGRSDAAQFVGELLCREVPGLAGGRLRIASIARRPGVLTKVVIRSVPGESGSASIGADDIARVREQLDGERIEVITWSREAPRFVADALGLGEAPPMLMLPTLGHVHVLLGEIDLRGIAGWRGLNVLLASAVTGWRIRLKPVAATHAWRRLEAARSARTTLVGTALDTSPRGLRVELFGLHGLLPAVVADPGTTLRVRVSRLDPDEGRVWLTDRLEGAAQLRLPFSFLPRPAGSSV
jgi:transcription antitermination factor NusA-like protein